MMCLKLNTSIYAGLAVVLFAAATISFYPFDSNANDFVADFIDPTTGSITSVVVSDPNDSYWGTQYASGAFTSAQGLLDAIAAGGAAHGSTVTSDSSGVACSNGVTATVYGSSPSY